MKRTILAIAVIITLFSVVSGQGKAPDGEVNSGEDMEIIILFYAKKHDTHAFKPNSLALAQCTCIKLSRNKNTNELESCTPLPHFNLTSRFLK